MVKKLYASARHQRQRSPKGLQEHVPGVRTPKSGRQTKKMEEESPRARHGEGAACYNRDTSRGGSLPGSAQMGNVGLYVRLFVNPFIRKTIFP